MFKQTMQKRSWKDAQVILPHLLSEREHKPQLPPDKPGGVFGLLWQEYEEARLRASFFSLRKILPLPWLFPKEVCL